MKLFTAIGLTLSLAAFERAAAQTIDLSAMSCQQFTQADDAQAKAIVTWLMGYYTEPSAPQVIDMTQLVSLRDKLVAFCKQQPQFRLEVAAEGILGK